MDDTFRTQWTITPHLPDESSALVDETHRRTQKPEEPYRKGSSGFDFLFILAIK